MDASLWVAIIAGVVALATAAFTAYFQWWQRRTERRQDKEEAAEALIARYRDPLLDSAFQLQSRLFNVCAQDFLERFLRSDDPHERRYAEESTVWIVGQFLCWAEIVRRDVQFLDLGEIARNQRLDELLWTIRGTMADSIELPDRALRVFAAEQRAIGELMIVPGPDGARDCMGYAEFSRRLASPDFARWFAPLRGDLQAIAQDGAPARAALLQRQLVDLIEFLDEGHQRLPKQQLTRLPLPEGDEHDAAS